MTTLGEGRDVLLGIDELELGRNEEVCAGNLARAIDRDSRSALVRGTKRAEHETLHVQDDVGDILDHVGNRGELVLGAIDLDGLDGCTLERGKQHAAQGVTQRVAIPALQRLDGNASSSLADLLDVNLGPDEFGHVIPPA